MRYYPFKFLVMANLHIFQRKIKVQKQSYLSLLIFPFRQLLDFILNGHSPISNQLGGIGLFYFYKEGALNIY